MAYYNYTAGYLAFRSEKLEGLLFKTKIYRIECLATLTAIKIMIFTGVLFTEVCMQNKICLTNMINVS